MRQNFRLKKRNGIQLGGAVIVLALSCLPAAAGLRVMAPRCEYRENPRSVDEAQPRLSWRVESDQRNQRQSAWHVLVATREDLLQEGRADLWDSGKMTGDQTINILYGGKPLPSRQQCFWQVRVWDATGEPSSWGPVASWAMGLQPEDWAAEYISYRDTDPLHRDPNKLYTPPARQYRKEFQATKQVRRATIYATALGIYELHLNGERVGNSYFAPGWTDYQQRAYYFAHDVTGKVGQGANAVGAWVAEGWYSGYLGFGLLTGMGVEKIGRYTYGKTPAFMAQLEIEYADGTHEVVVTDKSWKVTERGPIQEADFQMGEFYDARREMPGWSKPGFDESSWENAILASENGSTRAMFYEGVNPESAAQNPQIKGREVELGFKRPPVLQAFPGVPVRATEEIPAVSVRQATNGAYIFDLGQNIAGVVRLKVKGPAGTTIQLRHGEMLYPDGRLMTENLRRARAIDHYVLKGDPRGETYTPRFTSHGFQYVEVSGYPGVPDKDVITGVVLHSDTPLVSDFTCSDPVLNRLFQNIVWTQRGNFIDLPTDCPQRDERFGWTGDAQVYVRAATYNADVAAFYTKWLRELMESQRPSGAFPGFAPHPFQHGWDFGTAWADAGVICPWTIWQVYDDTRIIERCWEPMVRFLEWRKRTSKDFLGVNHGNDWGDWLSFGGKTPLEYIDTVYFGYSAKLMADMARAIGKDREAREYRELFQKVKSAFNNKYVKEDGSLTVDTQTAYALALFTDLIPASLRTRSGEILASKIRERASSTDSGITTGFLGTRALLPVLSSVSQHNLAVQLIQSRKFPSWGYEVEQGATTIWERWNSYTKDNGFGGEQNAAMNSFSHYSFGAVCEWMFASLAGISSQEPGFARVIISPSPSTAQQSGEVERLAWVKARHDSIRGRITSEWKDSDGSFELKTQIPANTTALVYLPARNVASIREGGEPLTEVKGVRALRMEGDRAVLSIGSGEYHFITKK